MICPHCKKDTDVNHEPEAVPLDILNACSAHYGVTIPEMMSTSRAMEIVKARHLSMYLMKRYTKRNLVTIGRYFRKDHTTVIHGIKRVEDAIDTKTDVYQDLQVVKARLTKQNEAA